ncbi:MAG: dethiobiotin synthase [Gammaproteobacteria bacterium]|nr:dethiobiotin synthase [Gammaproteobacteria bacterium]
MKRLFVTGTDTEIGKTVVASGLVSAAVTAGYRVAGLKPVAAGCETVNGSLVNDDARQLMRAGNVDLDYATVNPIALEPPIAPHIAAHQAGVSISARVLKTHYDRNLPDDLDLALFEGAGGWFVPLNDYETFQDFALGLKLDVVLVVGMKLGCINHAMLTVRAIRACGLDLIGWIANFPQATMDVVEENLDTLMRHIDAPLLGVVPHMDTPNCELVAKHLNIKAIMS